MGSYSMAQKLRFAAKMRRNPSYPEKKLWDVLSARKWAKDSNGNCMFETQVLILGWIVDFYCAGKKLVIEVDGEAFHDPKHDRYRDSAMKAEGYTVIRFPAKDIVNHFEFSRIVAIIKALIANV